MVIETGPGSPRLGPSPRFSKWRNKVPIETSNSRKQKHGASLIYQSPGQKLSYQQFIYLYTFASNIYIPTPPPQIPEHFQCGWLVSWLLMGPGKQTSRQFLFLCTVGRGAVTEDGSQPPPPGGGRSESATRRRQPLLPFAPTLGICPCSRRSCCCRPGCLGGRLRVT